ncbi:MAG TPA: hypothetical protein PLX14_11080 [Anaerolineales bacterium]|nr:hypothetical protein [Anaerolineales bacterium]
MKKYILFFALLSLSCSSLIPTPDDFPEPPMTVIVEDFPTLVITPTVETRIAVITSDKMAEAQTFQLILLTMVAAGDSLGIAEMVKYPLSVNLDDTSLILNADEFEENYDRLFTEQVIEVISDTSESNLTLLTEGVRVGHGEIWFNLFCMDAACSETQFFITQINN